MVSPQLRLFSPIRFKGKYVAWLLVLWALSLVLYFSNTEKEYTDFFQEKKERNITCSNLFLGDKEETAKAQIYQDSHPKIAIPEWAFTELATNCDDFKQTRQYILGPTSEEERTFPIAFSILVHKDPEQLERLLRVIYRPHNYYCVHIDWKTSGDIYQAIYAISKCFDNVFVASRRIDVRWGKYSLLGADIVCMEELWKYTKWRYFINLTGQEFPLKTNLELVRILKAFNGANNIEGSIKRRADYRLKRSQGFIWPFLRKEAAPHGIQVTKGSVRIAASRAFVDFVLHHKVALDFRDWVKDTRVPDETFFSTLNHNPQLGIPGAYKGEPESHPDTYPYLVRFVNWGGYPYNYPPCHGKRVRGVCIFSVGDLQYLSSRPELFLNKFHLDYNPLALECMEELYFNKTKAETMAIERTSLNITLYEMLPFVHNHV